MRSTGNKAIAEAIRNGDDLAFEVFFRAEYNNVVSFLFRYIRDFHLSQDLAQDAFIQLWKNRERIVPELNLRAYVFTAARNLAINRMSLKLHKSAVDIESRQARLRMSAMAHSSVSEKIEALDLSRLISEVYAELPDNVLESFVMSREYSMTYAEIAAKRGISAKSVEYHIKLALKLFRERLKEFTVCTAIFFFLFS